jgi:hypothetical protein
VREGTSAVVDVCLVSTWQADGVGCAWGRKSGTLSPERELHCRSNGRKTILTLHTLSLSVFWSHLCMLWSVGVTNVAKMERFVGGDVGRYCVTRCCDALFRTTDQRLDHWSVCDDTRSTSVKGKHRVACVPRVAHMSFGGGFVMVINGSCVWSEALHQVFLPSSVPSDSVPTLVAV